MSSETRFSNASQKSDDSDTTFCEELEKSSRSLRKQRCWKSSQYTFYSQTPTNSKMNDKNKKIKNVLEDSVFKIRNHLSKVHIMSINEIQSLINDVDKVDTPNERSKLMKKKVSSQLKSLFEETNEIEQRFGSMNLTNSSSPFNISQNFCSKIVMNDTITSNKTNVEQPEKSISFDFGCSSEVNVNRFPNGTHSSSNTFDTIQNDLMKLEEIEIFKNQDPTKRYFEEILQKSSAVSYSFDENMLSNMNFKTPSLMASLSTQIELDQSEKSNITEVDKDLPITTSSEDIIPSSLVDENDIGILQGKLISSIPSSSQNTVPSSTYTEGLFVSQGLKVDKVSNDEKLNEDDDNLTLKLEGTPKYPQQSKDVAYSPILKKKRNYQTQKCRYTKYSTNYKSKNFRNTIKQLKTSKVQVNNIKILQQVCVVPAQKENYSLPQAKEFNALISENENAQNLNNIITPDLMVDDNRLECTVNENSVCSNSCGNTLKDIVEGINKFKREFANWILQTATEEHSKKANSLDGTQNIPKEKDITDLNFELTEQEKIECESKINEIAKFYRDKIRNEELPKLEDFTDKPFFVDFDEIDKKYQQQE